MYVIFEDWNQISVYVMKGDDNPLSRMRNKCSLFRFIFNLSVKRISGVEYVRWHVDVNFIGAKDKYYLTNITKITRASHSFRGG
jgi:hypothetical protein